MAWKAREKGIQQGLTFAFGVLRLIPMEPCAEDKGRAGFWVEGVRIQLRERLTW